MDRRTGGARARCVAGDVRRGAGFTAAAGAVDGGAMPGAFAMVFALACALPAHSAHAGSATVSEISPGGASAVC